VAKITLLDGPTTPGQNVIIGAWYVNLALMTIVWSTTSLSLLTNGGAGGFFVSIGRLLGLLATTFALTQFMLMGRLLWIERRFGLDHLAHYHRLNGYLALGAILLHPIFIVEGYSLQSHTGYIHQYANVIQHYQYAFLALIAEILFVLVVISSVYIVRKHLKFENWYLVHMSVYVAIILVSFHQFAVGGSFIGHPLARLYWLLVYLFVALNIVVWRFGLPTFNLSRFKFTVQKVVAETATTTSVYIHGNNLAKWRAKPGQFVLIRILNAKFGLEEHPFSMSAIPKDNVFRLTIRDVGSYTKAIADLKPGAKVLVSGPFGRFTKDVAHTQKRLFIAGGVGITPLRTLAEEAAGDGLDSVLLYANRSPSDVVFENELSDLTAQGLKLVNVYSEADVTTSGLRGRIDGDLIIKTVPDWKQRDIYLCGPPPMMNAIIAALETAGVNPLQLHYENFALHN
jgi:predicted ferric reductase